MTLELLTCREFVELLLKQYNKTTIDSVFFISKCDHGCVILRNVAEIDSVCIILENEERSPRRAEREPVRGSEVTRCDAM